MQLCFTRFPTYYISLYPMPIRWYPPRETYEKVSLEGHSGCKINHFLKWDRVTTHSWMEASGWEVSNAKIWLSSPNRVGGFRRRKILCREKLLEACTSTYFFIGTQLDNQKIA